MNLVYLRLVEPLFLHLQNRSHFTCLGLVLRLKAVREGLALSERSVSSKEHSRVTIFWAERSMEGSAPKCLSSPGLAFLARHPGRRCLVRV